jgi:hypothetical protein
MAQVDAEKNTVLRTVAVGHRPLPVVTGFDSVWVRNEEYEGNSSVSRLDPRSGSVIATVSVGPDAGRDGLDGLGVSRDGVWVAGLRVQKIDPSKNEVVLSDSHTENAVTVAGGSVWGVDVGYSVTRIPLDAHNA